VIFVITYLLLDVVKGWGSPAKATPESPPLRKFSKVLEKKKKKGRAGAPWE
jgi:hypothetical protein